LVALDSARTWPRSCSAAASTERAPESGCLCGSLWPWPARRLCSVTSRRVAVIGVTSSTGTHHAGQDQGPHWRRNASRTCADRLPGEHGRVAPGVATAGGGPSGRRCDRARHRRAAPAPSALTTRPPHHLPASRPSLRPRESCPWLLTGGLSAARFAEDAVVKSLARASPCPTSRRSCRRPGSPAVPGAQIGPAFRMLLDAAARAWRTCDEPIPKRVVTNGRRASRCCWLGLRCGRRPVSRCSASHVRHRHG
jgi:hypothetical protein